MGRISITITEQFKRRGMQISLIWFKICSYLQSAKIQMLSINSVNVTKPKITTNAQWI